jgi:endonuclease/exonuclease/phosphatase (EEP) superfamily protein YafD
LTSSATSKIENIWVEINKNQQKYVIGGIYRHPNQNITEFRETMETVLNKLSCQNIPCIIAGDINIDLAKCTASRETAEYVEDLLMHNFMPSVVMPTRITSNSATIIDHIYYYEGNNKRKNVAVKSGNLVDDISDHLPNYILLINEKKPKINPLSAFFLRKINNIFIILF